MEELYETATHNAEEMTSCERKAFKYNIIKEKINLHFEKGCRIVKIAKITVAAIFFLFSLIAVIVSNRTGNQMQWLIAWIVLIFVNVFIFVIVDYSRYLIESKVIPYLNDDEQLEFGEYDIFAEDIDNSSDEEEAEEDED